MTEYDNNRAILIAAFAFSLFIGGFMYVSYRPGPYGCLKYKKIKSVGGCDRYGDCGVLFEDGSYKNNVRLPVVDQTICSHTRAMFYED